MKAYQATSLSASACEEFHWRAGWSVYKLPKWVRKPYSDALRIAKMKRAAKKKAHCGGCE